MKHKKNIHFIGIGGIGMSSLAQFYHGEGVCVSGSDENEIDVLDQLNIKTYKGHSEENISQEVDLVVYSSAILQENPEFKEAVRRGVEIVSYAEALGEITKEYFTIAVSGTHGKSTTTGMLAIMLIEAGFDPTVIVGTKLDEFGGSNFRKGRSKYLVIEADEFKAALLNYSPDIAVITNIEEDHLDFYKDLDHILETFKKYLKDNLKGGVLVLNKDDENSQKIRSAATGRILDYSLAENSVDLSVPGKHNVYNALAVLEVARELNIEESVARKGLKKFKGTWRRFEEKKIITNNNLKINLINDYAHHPTEIRATLQAIDEKYPERRVVVVFQPHQYERTYRLFDQFVRALSSFTVENLLIADIYTVKGRESEEVMRRVDTEMLVEKIPGAIYSGNISQTAELVLRHLQENDILVIMGAGDVYRIEEVITKSYL